MENSVFIYEDNSEDEIIDRGIKGGRTYMSYGEQMLKVRISNHLKILPEENKIDCLINELSRNTLKYAKLYNDIEDEMDEKRTQPRLFSWEP